MSTPSQQAVLEFQPLYNPIMRALTCREATHGVLLLYLKLLYDAEHNTPACTIRDRGKELDWSEKTVARGLRILRKLGIVRDSGNFLFVLTHTADRRIIKALEGIAAGRGVVDVMKGVISALETGKIFDYTQLDHTDIHVLMNAHSDVHVPLNEHSDVDVRLVKDEPSRGRRTSVRTYPELSNQQTADHPSLTVKNPHIYKSRSTVVVNKSRSTSTRRNTNHLITIENSTPNAELEIAPKAKWAVEEIPVTADKLPHNKLFDPFRDPFQADIESVVGYANEKLGTRYSLYSATGAPNDRYRVVFRCFYHFGLSAVDLKKAVDNIPRHDYWGPRKVRDLLKLFREQSNCEGLVNYVPPDADPKDRRALDCASVAAGRIVISEEL